jgi:hypothetical protein
VREPWRSYTPRSRRAPSASLRGSRQASCAFAAASQSRRLREVAAANGWCNCPRTGRRRAALEIVNGVPVRVDLQGGARAGSSATRPQPRRAETSTASAATTSPSTGKRCMRRRAAA